MALAYYIGVTWDGAVKVEAQSPGHEQNPML
jgi:hypothetical protein